MKSISRMVQIAGSAVLLGIALPIYAESAPVYDVDAMPQQYDSQQQDSQDYDPPPPPGQEGTFAPMQQQPLQQAPSPRMGPPLSTDQRLQRVEQQISNMQSSDAVARMDSLQNQVQSLHSQVEQLIHQLEQLQAQQKSMYADLDKRVSQPKSMESLPAPISAPKSVANKASAKPTTSQGAVPATKPATPPDDIEEKSYKNAYNLIKAKKYDDAIVTLQDMLKKYPSGQFASNAHYWLGELYGLTGKNDQALKEFTIMVTSYPQSPRAGDAQLKVGLLYATQSKWSDAKAAFKKVVSHYPGTAPARLASEQLKQLKQAGH